MAIDIAVLSASMAGLVAATALLSPVLKLHSRLELMEYRMRRIEDLLDPRINKS